MNNIHDNDKNVNNINDIIQKIETDIQRFNETKSIDIDVINKDIEIVSTLISETSKRIETYKNQMEKLLLTMQNNDKKIVELENKLYQIENERLNSYTEIKSTLSDVNTKLISEINKIKNDITKQTSEQIATEIKYINSKIEKVIYILLSSFLSILIMIIFTSQFTFFSAIGIVLIILIFLGTFYIIK